MLAGLHATFPDLRFVVHDEIAEGDKVASTWTMSGTHRGAWLGVPAAGRRLWITGCDILHVRDGRIARVEIQANYLWAMRRMGAIAPTA